MLGACSALCFLDLTDSEIGAEGARQLIAVLKGCKAQPEKDLRRNSLIDKWMDEEGLEHVKAVLGTSLQARVLLGRGVAWAIQ
eukprot:1212700-Rhodomonas_salina.1